MAIKITWLDFDKTVFVTPKNMRKLMGFTIQIGGDIEKVENRLGAVETSVEDAKKDASDALEIGKTNQSGILEMNRNYREIRQSITEINAAISGLVIEIDDLKRRVSALERG
ncbi:MAG: hypothetical protein [Podoviridae sp. ctbd591]|nr:MAG: hypothetical protein [Podoviridae sp. ctbd591]